MLFHTLEFWAFFAIVLVLFYSLPIRFGKVVLLIASYIFYMRWDPRFALLIFASTVLDYCLGIAIATERPRLKKLLLIVSIVANLGILGFFKYYNFFASSLALLTGVPENSWLLQIVLPVGISFYTFKSMSYTIDVYMGWLKPVRNFLDYAAFVVFFPELVAGPIVRADVFFPQWFNWKKPTAPEVQNAIYLLIIGLVKKLVFADRFAVIADEYFGNIAGHPGAFAAWWGVFAFAMQIFFDFSGYTDMARGCAQLLGIQFPINFNRPYLSTNITEFWKRWHISLSQWLRDYLYIPLGGNRHGDFITCRNLMLTMLLGGLWHGASVNFIIWGGFHGLLLLLHRLWTKAIKGTAAQVVLDHPVFVPLKIMVTLACVLVGWVFFRAATLRDSCTVVQAMFTPAWAPVGGLLPATAIIFTLLALVIAVIEERYRLIARLYLSPAWVRVSSYVCLFFMLEFGSAAGNKIPFIYFQF